MINPFYINLNDIDSFERYLRQQSWIKSNERLVNVEKAGEGNMNLVLRIVTNERSFIVKQARPWVEKYPDFEAPVERNLVEVKYYEMIQHNHFLQSLSPKLLWKDENCFVLALEDLGAALDMTTLYEQDVLIGQEELLTLTRYLSELHKSVNTKMQIETISNLEMRKLNHYHIFVFPFETENAFNLNVVQQGLHEIAAQFRNDIELKETVAGLGDLYFSDGETLLHGDYYPGSWLKGKAGIKVIDPEFCFFGQREFDLGVMLAHMKLSMQSEMAMQTMLEYYKSDKLDMPLLLGFSGVEIMRRLLGMAQLPLSLSLMQKKELLEGAYRSVMNPEFQVLM